MPELPEVALTAIKLNERIGGTKLHQINIKGGRYLKHGKPEGLIELEHRFPCTIEEVDFHGKLLTMKLKDSAGKDWWMWNTFGMSGGWKSKQSKHGHVEFVTDAGNFYYTDARNFGTIKFTDSLQKTEDKIATKGPNHIKEEISDDLFKQRIQMAGDKNICKVLMDQRYISGIGNYIKAEVLYRCKISPHRTTGSLTDEEFSLLNKYTNEVIWGSFYKGGATLRSYLGLDFDKGNYVFHFKVYGRSKCDNGYKVIREETPDGRTTHWVKEIQK